MLWLYNNSNWLFYVFILIAFWTLINKKFFFYCSYNGFLPQGDRGRRRSKFVLHKRSEHNGVKRSKHYIVQTPQTSQAILDTTQHSISYTLSRSQAVIVEYKEDQDTDMFQVRKIFENFYIKIKYSTSFNVVVVVLL